MAKVAREPRGAVLCPELCVGVQLQSRAGPVASSLWMPSWPRPGSTNAGWEPTVPYRGIGTECQGAWNSQPINQTSWKYGQEPMQMATGQKAAGLLGTGGMPVQMLNWDVSEMLFSPHLCQIVSAQERNRPFKYILSFWDSVLFLEISPRLLKCEFYLETCRWKFLEGLFVYRNKMWIFCMHLH